MVRSDVKCPLLAELTIGGRYSQQPAEDDDSAAKSIEPVVHSFLERISQSIADVPFQVRDICSHIADAVEARFPDSVFTA